MQRYIILTRSPGLEKSLKGFLKGFSVEPAQVVSKVVSDPPSDIDVSRKFLDLCDWLESEIASSENFQGIPEVVVITDFAGDGEIELDKLNPITHFGWATVMGMLIIAFPEVHWVMMGSGSGDCNSEIARLHCPENPEELRQLLSITSNSIFSLFDISGLRNAVKMQICRDSVNGEETIVVPLRKLTAISIDDEIGYSFFHAYTAYRFGFRSSAITTMRGMKEFLMSPAIVPTVVFEDLFLHFPDETRKGFSRLKRRDDSNCDGFPNLREVGYRVFVTSGHQNGRSKEDCDENTRYLEELRDSGRWNHVAQKPSGGIFNLWRESGLFVRLPFGLALEFNGPFPCSSEERWRAWWSSAWRIPSRSWFHSFRRWFTLMFRRKAESVQIGEGGHSAPGRLLVVASRLISRSERILSDVRTIPQASYGAVLATDALEILGGKTPTTSLEALILRHHFETLAECQFVGTQHHIDVRSRIRDLVFDVKMLSRWFGDNPKKRRVAEWNSELAILNRLIEVFSKHNQFDEEQFVSAHARRLHRRLWFERFWVFKPFQFAPWYVEKLLASFPVFLIMLVVWILALGFACHWVGGPDVPLGQAMADSYSSFLGVQPPSDESLWKASHGWTPAFCIISVMIASGFLHLGIFISHLYSVVARK